MTTQLSSNRLGPIEIDDDAVISFDRGLLGLEESTTSMVLIQFDESPYFWLHSTTDPDVAMIVVDPWQFWPDYEIDIPEPVEQDLGFVDPSEVEVMVLVSIRSAPSAEGKPEVSANLLGPLVVNSKTRKGRQLVLENANYSARTRMET